MTTYFIINHRNERFNIYRDEYLRAIEYANKTCKYIKTTQYRNGLVKTYENKKGLLYIVSQEIRINSVVRK